MHSRSTQLLRGGLLALLAAAGAYGCGSSSSTSTLSTPATLTTASRTPGTGKPPVTLATKNFTEQLILGQLYAQALRAKGFKVTLKSDVGASEVVNRKLAAGEIDGYPEYTGTILSVVAHQSVRPASAQEAYSRAAAFERSRGRTLLAMSPATDTNVVVAKPTYAAQHRLRSLADLTRLDASATLAGPPEFRTRFSGLVGLRQAYRVSRLRFLPVKIGTQYRALADGRLQTGSRARVSGSIAGLGATFDVEVIHADTRLLELVADGPVSFGVAYRFRPHRRGLVVDAQVTVPRKRGLTAQLLRSATVALLNAGALRTALGRLEHCVRPAIEPELVAA